MRYVDPDGRVTKHNDLQGFDRLKAEAKDIIQGKFKIGIFAGANITLWEALNVGAEVDLGSIECNGSINNDVKTTESAGISFDFGVLEFIKAYVDLKWAKELSNDEEIGNYFQIVKDIIKNGEFTPDVGAKIGPLTTCATNDDVKVGAEVGLCIGIGLWINLSEIKDFFKGWMNGDY